LPSRVGARSRYPNISAVGSTDFGALSLADLAEVPPAPRWKGVEFAIARARALVELAKTETFLFAIAAERPPRVCP
jgi:hypothetical protein